MSDQEINEQQGGDDGDDQGSGVTISQEDLTARISAATGPLQEALTAKEKKVEELMDEIKGKYKPLGTPSELKAKLEELASIKAEQAAGQHGKTGEEWTKAVDEAAHSKFEQLKALDAERDKASREELESSKGRLTELEAELEKQYARASIAEAEAESGRKLVNPAARQYVVDAMASMIRPHKPVEGGPELPRVFNGDAIRQGKSGDMTPLEALELARLNKLDGCPDLSFFFLDHGQGADLSEGKKAEASGDPNKMTTAQKAAYIKEHGLGQWRELVAKSQDKKAAGQ